jgi:hypothetical protein
MGFICLRAMPPDHMQSAIEGASVGTEGVPGESARTRNLLKELSERSYSNQSRLFDTQAIRLISPGSSGSHAIGMPRDHPACCCEALALQFTSKCQPQSTQLEDHEGSDPKWRDCIVARRESSIAPGSFLLDSA